MSSPFVRITPAYTGKSFIKPCTRFAMRDHPRIHGEKRKRNKLSRWKIGSPPHTRGKVVLRVQPCRTCRITPAYTGKSEFMHIARNVTLGSPPHTRGKEYSWSVGNAAIGITPAYTGKRYPFRKSVSINQGSPPHTRGKVCSCYKLLI